VFVLELPAGGFRDKEVLAFHARDPASSCERVDGRRICKALRTPDGAVVREVSLEKKTAHCRIHGDVRLGNESMQFLHAAALRMLGLTVDVAAFEARARRAAPFAA
jgi:DNA-3-methyladenine glycosylase II